MQCESLPIKDALKITPRAFADERGLFKEVYSASRYASVGLHDPFVQDNISLSSAGTLRGLHADMRMGKLVQVLAGSAYDVLVDLRRDSPTFLHHYGTVLGGAEHTQLWIPAGCLHGFLALEDDTILSYKQTAEYDPKSEFGVVWNDRDLAIQWPLDGASPRLSPKDAVNPTLRDLGYL